MPTPGFVRVAQADELTPGQMKMVEVGEEQVLLANVDGTIYACADICSHAFASLSEGDLNGAEVQCPLHGGSFDVTTGEPTGDPAEDKIKTYEVRVSGQEVLLGPARE